MAGIKKRKRFFGAMSGTFKKQTGFGAAQADNLLNKRIKAQITFNEVNPTDPIYDCEEQDPVGETETGKLMEITITYAQISAQILFGWICYLLSVASMDAASQTNEVQTVSDLAAGDTITFAFDGKTSTSKPVTDGMSAAAFQALLEAMDSIKAGNVTVTGTFAGGFVCTFGGRLAHTNLPLMTITGDGTVAQTTAGSNPLHHATRSTDDVLALFSLLTGFKAAADTMEKFYNVAVNSIAIALNRRRDVTATISLIGRFTPEELASFTVPDCELPDPLHGKDVRIQINDAFITDLLNAGTITLNNAIDTSEDAYPFDDDEIGELMRGEKPTYPITLQLLGSKGDANHTLAKNKQEADLKIHIGKPSDRLSLIFPNAHFALGSDRLGYTTSGKSYFPVVITPYKDETLEAPLRAEASLADQITAFLTT